MTSSKRKCWIGAASVLASFAFAGLAMAQSQRFMPLSRTTAVARPSVTPRTVAAPTTARPIAAATTINAGHRVRAEKQILVAVRSQDPYLRSNAIEAGAHLPGRAASLIAIGLRDRVAAVRFASLAMMGKLRLRAMSSSARPLLNDQNMSVRAAALFALHMCGHKVDLSPMAGYLGSEDAGVKANAALLMGMMGDRMSRSMVEDQAAKPMSRSTSQERRVLVRLQFAEALVRLGDEKSLDPVRAGAFSQYPEVRVLAVSMLGRLEDRLMEPSLVGMIKKRPVELQLAAADALARMGRYDGLEVVLEASTSNLQAVRAQAAMTLGRFRQPQAVGALVRLLDDQSQQVRVAASAAVLSWGRPTR